MGCGGPEWSGVVRSGQEWSGLVRSGQEWAGVDCFGLQCAGVEQIGLKWTWKYRGKHANPAFQNFTHEKFIFNHYSVEQMSIYFYPNHSQYRKFHSKIQLQKDCFVADAGFLIIWEGRCCNNLFRKFVFPSTQIKPGTVKYLGLLCIDLAFMRSKFTSPQYVHNRELRFQEFAKNCGMPLVHLERVRERTRLVVCHPNFLFGMRPEPYWNPDQHHAGLQTTVRLEFSCL